MWFRSHTMLRTLTDTIPIRTMGVESTLASVVATAAIGTGAMAGFTASCLWLRETGEFNGCDRRTAPHHFAEDRPEGDGRTGTVPDFSAEALSELGRIQPSATTEGGQVRDLRDLLWASIDNDDSRDLDQLTVAEAMPGDKIKLLVAVADVDSVVTKGSAIDEHARHNTTSVYTAATIFPMLPEKLSTDITSLGFNVDRLTIVAEMVVGADGSLQNSDIYRACVRNRAKLAYDSVAAWLEGGTVPAAVAAVPGLDENLRLQDRAAQRMKDTPAGPRCPQL